MTRIWSSFQIPAQDRLDFWVDAVCLTLVRLRCEPRRNRPFFGEISYDELGPLKLVNVQSIGQRVSRSSSETADDQDEYYHVNVMPSGCGLMVQDGREAVLGPGGFVFSDSAQPYTIDFTSDFSSRVLRIPRPMLLRRIGAPENFTAWRVDGMNRLGANVASLLHQLPMRLSAIPVCAYERVADNIVDLVAAALLSTADDAPVPARLTLTRVKFWIEIHLTEKTSRALSCLTRARERCRGFCSIASCGK